MSDSNLSVHGGVLYTKARAVHLHYTYTNRQPGDVDLWLSLPPELPMQRNIHIEQFAPEPVSVQTDGLNLNQLAFVRLSPGETLHFRISADLYDAKYDEYATNGPPVLSETERALYLRSSSLIQMDDAVRSEALAITGEIPDPIKCAQRLYMYLIKHSRYQWPPASRGSEAMRCNRPMRGDCGNYSFLYAAWCRALNIPCRVLIGTWIYGTSQGHVWNEVFIDGIGWVPVDTSFHAQRVYVPLLSELEWMIRRVKRHWGRVNGNRLAFSIDTDIPLSPPFGEEMVPQGVGHLNMGNKSLAWGFESLHGAALYLQPAYPRFHAVRLPLRASAQLGKWHFADQHLQSVLTVLLWTGFGIGVLGTLRITSLGHFPTSLGWVIANAILIYRDGPRWWTVGLFTWFLIETIMAGLPKQVN